MYLFVAELRAKRASAAPWVSKSTHPTKFGNHVTVHRTSFRTTGKPMFNFTFSSSFRGIGKLILHTYCTSMLWSIDSCQNRVSADQCHLTLSRAQVSAHRGRVFFEVIRWQVTSLKMIAGSSFFFLNSYKICCVYVLHRLKFDFKLTSDVKIQ